MDQQALTMKHTLGFEAFELDELFKVDADDEESLVFDPDVEIFGIFASV